MTVANPQPGASGRRAPDTGGTRRLGGWALLPAATDLFEERRVPYLQRGGERVHLRHCSGLLEDFLGVLRQVETDYLRRCAGALSDVPR